MRLHTIREKQTLNLSLPGAWTFFSNPRNLSLLTPPSLGLELGTDQPQEMHPGMILTYRIRPLLGIPMRWVTEITHVVPLRMFVDEQRFGPYRFWHHLHLFREAPGGVEMEDLVHYALPFGPLGRGVNAFITARQVRKIFEFRRLFLDRSFGEVPPTGTEQR
jgi:ligand-binding SRPBCC domain-containing protein